MRPPSRIKTLAGEVKVCFSDAIDDCGNYDSGKARINISPDLAPDIERITLLHELTHDILHRTGVENGLDKDDQERICDGLALGVLEIIRRNPALLDYLTS